MNAYELTLSVLLRYYLVTTRALNQGALKDFSPKSIEKALATLQRQGLVRAYEFDGRSKVYGLTTRAARRHGLDPKRFRRPPGVTTVVESLVMLQFCTCGPVERKRLTAREFEEKFPELAKAEGVTRTRYYIDRSREQPRLAVIVPDYGAEYYRVAKKARAAIHKRLEHVAFRDLIYNDLLQVTVVTGFQSKAEEIRRALGGKRFAHLITVEVVPELGDLLLKGETRD